jgi:hypothetical protein
MRRIGVLMGSGAAGDPDATSRLRTLLKKRFSKCCKESQAGCRKAGSSLADHVHR